MTDEYLPKILANQAEFLKITTREELKALGFELASNPALKGFNLVEDIGNPDKILRSANFQYLVKGNNVQIINKYF